MITFDRDGARFNYRVAGVAIRDHRVMLQRFPDDDFWVLPGGRVDLLEPAADALRREMREELGLVVDVGRPLWVVENFFVFQRTPYHELSLYFEMNLPADAPALRASTFTASDGLVCSWTPLDALHGVTLQPTFLKQRLTSLPKTLEHIVHRDPVEHG